MLRSLIGYVAAGVVVGFVIGVVTVYTLRQITIRRRRPPKEAVVESGPSDTPERRLTTIHTPFNFFPDGVLSLLHEKCMLDYHMEKVEQPFFKENTFKVDVDRITSLIDGFGHVEWQLPPKRLIQLLQSHKTRYFAAVHFISTTIYSSLRLESKHQKLLVPELVSFYNFCYQTPKEETGEETIPTFAKYMAQFRGICTIITPDPETSREQKALKDYLMKVLEDFVCDGQGLELVLDDLLPRFASFGATLMLDPRRWAWSVKDLPESDILLAPALCQIEDERGKPLEEGPHGTIKSHYLDV